MLAELYRKYMPIMIRARIADWRMKNVNKEAMRRIQRHEYHDEYEKECKYMDEKGSVATFPYAWSEKYRPENIQVIRDESCLMDYVMHKGYRLYFPRKYPADYIKRLYNSLLIEQDMHSTHCYFDVDKVDMHGKTFFDIGAAEGIIALSIAEQAKNIVLFEADRDWNEALHHTFKPWEEKTTIINCYAGEIDGKGVVAIDTVAKKYENIVLKMDVEGMELSVLNGARKTLEKNNTEIYVCVYHHEDDEIIINKFLERNGYCCSVNQGYIFYGNPLSFRHGVLHAEKQCF